jgi:hypothetical protein
MDFTFFSNDPEVAAKVLAAAGGYGADFVLDLVSNSDA